MQGESKKPIETGYTAIAKMAYEILVWVLILLSMILDQPYSIMRPDPDQGHAQALRIQY